MPVQINLGHLKINAVDKAFVNIGPSVQHITRTRSRYNFGSGEVMGYGNTIREAFRLVNDNDVIDHVIQKKVVIRRG